MRELKEYEQALFDLVDFEFNPKYDLREVYLGYLYVIKELVELRKPKELVKVGDMKVCPTCLLNDIYDEWYDTHEERSHYCVKKYCGNCGQMLVQREEDDF